MTSPLSPTPLMAGGLGASKKRLTPQRPGLPAVAAPQAQAVAQHAVAAIPQLANPGGLGVRLATKRPALGTTSFDPATGSFRTF